MDGTRSLHYACLPHVCTGPISFLLHRTEPSLTFWEFTARLSWAKSEEGSTVPRKMDLYWFMPALANRRVGSECGTTDDEGTANYISTSVQSTQALVLPNVCPFFLKKSMKVSRTRTAGHFSVIEPMLDSLLTNSWASWRCVYFEKIGDLVWCGFSGMG